MDAAVPAVAGVGLGQALGVITHTSIVERGVPVLFVLNKADQPDCMSQKTAQALLHWAELTSGEALASPVTPHLEMLQTSALDGQGLQALLRWARGGSAVDPPPA